MLAAFFYLIQKKQKNIFPKTSFGIKKLELVEMYSLYVQLDFD